VVESLPNENMEASKERKVGKVKKAKKSRQAIRKRYERGTHIVVPSLFCHRSPSPDCGWMRGESRLIRQKRRSCMIKDNLASG
jgi:hypothetical protein